MSFSDSSFAKYSLTSMGTMQLSIQLRSSELKRLFVLLPTVEDLIPKRAPTSFLGDDATGRLSVLHDLSMMNCGAEVR